MTDISNNKKYNKSNEPRKHKGRPNYLYVPKKKIECECGQVVHEGMLERHLVSKQHSFFMKGLGKDFVKTLTDTIREDILNSFGIQNGFIPQNIIGVDTQEPLEPLVEG